MKHGIPSVYLIEKFVERFNYTSSKNEFERCGVLQFHCRKESVWFRYFCILDYVPIQDYMHATKRKETLGENQDDDMQSVPEESKVMFSSARPEFTDDFSKDDYIAELEDRLKNRTGGLRMKVSVRN